MEIKTLKPRTDLVQNKKANEAFGKYQRLLQLISDRDLAPEVIDSINLEIDTVNDLAEQDKKLRKQIASAQHKTLALLEKQSKIVAKNHYRNAWMAIGMVAFGLPIGTAIGASTDNIGMLGIGLPIGMVIGMAVGAGMDKKALNEGRQLDFEV